MSIKKNVLKGSAVALVLVLVLAWIFSTESGASVTRAMHSLRGFFAIAVGLAFLLTAIAVEWKTILHYRGIETVSLGDIERYHPRLPSRAEIVIAMIFTAVFALLFFQFVTIVYAMAFTLNSSSAETNDTRDVVMADFDNDGDLDYIAGNTDGGGWDVYSNDGTGNFTHMGLITGVSTNFTKFEAADMDGDGDVDLVYVKSTVDHEIGVIKNNGNFSFSQGYLHDYTSVAASVYGPLVLDADSDGDMDFMAFSDVPLRNTLHLNDGHGNFTVTASPLTSGNRAVAADFNSDGHIDIAMSYTANSVNIYRNSGTGAFVLMGSAAGIGGIPVAMAPADFDGDGDIDLLVLDDSTPSGINLMVNDGTGQFMQNSPDNVFSYSVTDLAAADFDNDGDIDFINVADYALSSDGNELWLNDGLGNFTNGWRAAGADTTSSSLAVGDIDGDGDLDYVLGRSGNTADDRLFSDQAATTANTAPVAPTSFSVSMTPESLPTISAAGAGSNTTETGSVAWSGTTNALASDNSYVSASLTNADRISNSFRFTNLGFAIPSNAVILGIKVDVEKSAPGTETVVDQSVRLVIGGALGSGEKANSTTNWSASDATTTYGGATDLWSASLTPADINATNFGFSLAARYVPLSLAGDTARIDQVRVTVYYATENTVRLNWGSGSDAHTPTKLLQYQLRVGTGSSAHNIVSGATASPYWASRRVPNGQSRTMILKNVQCGLTYYWSVATVDTGFKTTWGSEQQFSIDSSCDSGGGSSSSSSPSVGGGLSASYFRTNEEGASSALGTGIITVTAFNDIDGDSVKDQKELVGFKGLSFTASGRTVENLPVRRTMSVNDKGVASFDLPPSDDRGYWFMVATGSSVLQGFDATGKTASGGYILKSNQNISAYFGFRRDDLLAYKPCLTVGAAADNETGTDVEILLQRLSDVFGTSVTKGAAFSSELVTRRQFFTLLARTQCITLLRNATELETKVRARERSGKFSLPLLDLPIDPTKQDSLVMYSLLAAGVDVARETLRGSAADLSSPITRSEAIRAVYTVLSIPTKKRIAAGGVLPIDLDASDEIVPYFLTLQNLGALPESFTPILGPSQGLDAREAALFLVRSAFRGGKINLLPAFQPTQKKSDMAPTFLAVLPPLKQRVCLEKDSDRATSVGFTDVLPGDFFFESLQALLTRGTKNSAKKTLWLIAGTRRPTEFGITRGRTKAALSEPVSILETIRNLLVLACVPPDTALDVKSGKKPPVTQGSAESKVARDRISGVPRDASFASRVLYRAQDHQKEFDLSLFTYVPDLLNAEERSPATGLSVIEASRLLASGLLMIEVKNQSISPLQAENTMEELSAAIRRDLIGKDVDWRNESALKSVPFTRAMLIQFLATVTSGTVSVSTTPAPSTLPLGEIWWERIK